MVSESNLMQSMTTNNVHVISASKTIAAPPQRIYSILADYRDGHRSILPRQFTSMTVERGGMGAGTIIQFTMRLLGRTQHFRGFVSEPEPGRVLAETYETNGVVTSFIVEAGPASGLSQVTITSDFPVRSGLAGIIERFFSTRLLHPIYLQELELLAKRSMEA
jgi:hypothetical protein